MLANKSNEGEVFFDEQEFARMYHNDVAKFNSLISEIPQEIYKISKTKNKSGFIKVGKVVDVSLKTKKVYFDLGLKSEAVVDLNEFCDDNFKKIDPKIGDEFELYIESFDIKGKIITVSRSKVFREKVWLELKDSFENSKTVYGVIFKAINGGYAVDFKGILGFLPGSQVDIKIPKDISPLMNIAQPFKVISVGSDNTSNTSDKKIVVSRRAVIEDLRSAKKDDFLSTIKEGDIVQGVVKNIASYGAFIDLGTMDGLLHVADIGWKKVNHPSEVISIGDVVTLKVIGVDYETKKISLGMKQIQDSPWVHLKEKYKEGDVIKSKISNKVDYGLFVLIEQDVEGLVHISELAWTKDGCQEFHSSSNVGDEIDVKIVSFDIDHHKISLSRKEAMVNPWKEFVNKYQVGAKFKVKVVNVAAFGIFVELENNIIGLIHVSDISWSCDNDQVIKNYKTGDEIDVVLLSGDFEKQRISLGIKQLTKNPFEENSEILKEGSLVDAKVIKVSKDEIDVEICGGIISKIKRHNIPNEKITKSGFAYEIGEELKVRIVKIGPQNRFLIVSAKKIEEKEAEMILKNQKQQEFGSTLGSILGDAINLK
jgi:small subunit ribosomal protein S1